MSDSVSAIVPSGDNEPAAPLCAGFWPENRQCAACGHVRDVHGGRVMPNGGYRCNTYSGCDCPGFTPHTDRSKS